MYGANTLCDGQCSWGRGWKFAIPGCPVEIEWWFWQCSRHIFKKVCEGDRGNHVEELRSFPVKTRHNRPRNLRLPASPERENRLTWKPNGLPQMRLPNI
jgi:hypothetical protein